MLLQNVRNEHVAEVEPDGGPAEELKVQRGTVVIWWAALSPSDLPASCGRTPLRPLPEICLSVKFAKLDWLWIKPSKKLSLFAYIWLYFVDICGVFGYESLRLGWLWSVVCLRSCLQSVETADAARRKARLKNVQRHAATRCLRAVGLIRFQLLILYDTIIQY